MRQEPESVLTQGVLFRGIPEDHCAQILDHGEGTFRRAGETLFFQGDPARHCYLVLHGRLKMVKLHEQGRETLIRYVGPGEITAAIAVFKEKEYPVTGYAVTDARLVGWDKRTMRDLLQADPIMAINLLEAAVDRIDELQRRFMELCAEQVEQRLARAVLRFMQQAGRKTEQGILIDFRLSRQELADYTGTTLFTVSRNLSLWEKKGWIKSSRELIVVTDPHALVALSENGGSNLTDH
jgi:CRP-like cAMP-binding protein